jgi:disabled family protein 2
MTDGRAFGYIFGSPDCGHRFFGIKTDKAASQVVLAMRDLFQCVFELKKKEIELAKQHIQNRITAHEHQQVKNSILEHKKSSILSSEARASTSKPEKTEATANLVDLEQELSSIQRGITQMDRQITPSEEAPVKNVLDDDPFGDDSFASFSSTPFNILPPPSSSSKRSQSFKHNDELSSTTPPLPLSSTSSSANAALANTNQSSIDSWLQSNNSPSSIFKDLDSTVTNSKRSAASGDDDKNNKTSFNNEISNNENLTSPKSELIDAFTDLDPLGTGKSKPYVDKRYFFQDLKNPPKKILKDLSIEHDSLFDAHFSPQRQMNSGTSQSEVPKIDPFEEEDFSKINIDHLESMKSISPNQKSIILPDTKISSLSLSDENKSKVEDNSSKLSDEMASIDSTIYTDYKRQMSDGTSKNVFSVDSFSKKLPKAPNLFGQRNVKRDSNGINMRRLQESDSLSENEPELPPRPRESNEPPPLPPKNQRESSNEYMDRNRYSKTQTSGSRYDYTNKFKSQSSTDSPPNIPLPSRKINRNDSKLSRRSNDEDDYLTPNPTTTHDGFPQLPPPPLQKNSSKYRGPRKSDTDPKNLDAPTPPVSAKVDLSTLNSSILPDITLSQLLTLGIDDLAQKLNVPVSKLNTMTLVELTTYLSEFIEKSKQPAAIATPSTQVDSPSDSPVFKVNFDDAVFEAKFDDNFGEMIDDTQNHFNRNADDSHTFVANFDNFNQAPISVIPTADRYAVFREIIDQDIQHQQQSFEEKHQESIESNNSNSLEEVHESPFDFAKGFSTQYESPIDAQFKQSPVTVQSAKIENKITEALSGVKDRYAALRELRNIVLVEDLFDKTPKPPLASISDSNLSDEIPDDVSSFNQQIFETAEVADNNSLDNLPTYSVSWADAEDQDGVNSENAEKANQEDEEDQPKPTVTSLNSLNINNGIANKDDLEIDEYMNKAISELSLDQRLSPNVQTKSPMKLTDDENFSKHSTPSPIEVKKLSPCLIPTSNTSPSPALIADEEIKQTLEISDTSKSAKELSIEPDDIRGTKLLKKININLTNFFIFYFRENNYAS